MAGVPGVGEICKPGLRLQSADAEQALMQAMVANARCQLGECLIMRTAGIASACGGDTTCTKLGIVSVVLMSSHTGSADIVLMHVLCRQKSRNSAPVCTPYSCMVLFVAPAAAGQARQVTASGSC